MEDVRRCLLLSANPECDLQKTAANSFLGLTKTTKIKIFSPLTVYIFCQIINNAGCGKYQTLNKEFLLTNLARLAPMLGGFRPLVCRPDSRPRRAAHQQAAGAPSPRVHHILSKKSRGPVGWFRPVSPAPSNLFTR